MLDLKGIKEKIQTVFEAANTTTAASDLSSGLTTRVQRVLKVNPSRIPVQSDWYPFVSVFTEQKKIDFEDIALNQLNAKRSCEVTFKVVGAVWNSDFTNPDEDLADDDCEVLLENVEQVLRRNDNLGGLVTWQKPTDVTYHHIRADEGVSLRWGVLSLSAKIFY